MKKNGKIELLRFIFALLIVAFHVNIHVFDAKKMITDNISFSFNGNMGVEFFFIVTGFLMAMSVTKQIETKMAQTENITDETLMFLWRKIKAILPYQIICGVIMIILMSIKNPENCILRTILKLPSLFFLSRTGATATTGNLLRYDWYISSMIIAMVIIYPIARKYYKAYTHLVGPFLSIMIIGYLIHTRGCLSGATAWEGLTYACNLRAFAEISLGMTMYEISKVIQKKKFSLQKKVILSITEFLCYAFCFTFILSKLSNDYEFTFLVFVSIGVLLSFSKTGYLADTKIFQNRFCQFLGEISLPMYLSQVVAIDGVKYFAKGASQNERAVLTFVVLCVVTLLIHSVIKLFLHIKNVKKSSED